MIDIMAAQEFVRALTGSAKTEMRWQCLDDSGDKDPTKREQLVGDVYTVRARLEKENKRGCGIFVMVNESTGFTGADVTGLRAIFVDKDDGPLPSLVLRPNFLVRTARGEHAYWVLEPGQRTDQFVGVQKALAKKLGTDQAVHNLNRVMRLPGTKHHKGEPTDVKLNLLDSQKRHTLVEICEAFGLLVEDTSKETKPPPRSVDKAKAIERCRSYMAHVPPAIEGEGGDQATFRAACVGLDFGLTDEEFWPILASWNRTCEPPWREKDLRRKLQNASRYRARPIGEKAPEKEDEAPTPPEGWDTEDPPLQDEEPVWFDEDGNLTAPALENVPDEEPEQEEDERLHVYDPRDVYRLWQDRGETVYVPSPIKSFNRCTGGGYPVGAVTIITAYTGCYKSEVIRQSIKHAAQIGCAAIHVDVELGYKDIFDRYLSDESSLPHSVVRGGLRRSGEQTEALLAAAETVANQKWKLNSPGGGLPILDLERIISEALPDTKAKPTLVAFDSLQRLALGVGEDNARMRVERFCQWAEWFAKKYNVAVLVVSEQSRQQGGGKPTIGQALTSGAESRSVEYVASIVVALDCDDDDADESDAQDADAYGEKRVGLLVAKNRFGWCGRLKQELVFCRPFWRMKVEGRGPSKHEARLLECMGDKRWTIRQLMDECHAKHATVKRALACLEEAGRVIKDSDGRWVLCS